MTKSRREEISEMEAAVGEELERRAGTHTPVPTLKELPDLASAIDKIDSALPGMVDGLLEDFVRENCSVKDRLGIMKLLMQASLSSDRLKQALGLVKSAASSPDGGTTNILAILKIDVDQMRDLGPEQVKKMLEAEVVG